MKRLFALVLFLTAPAFADEVTLQIQTSRDDYKESIRGGSAKGDRTHDLSLGTTASTRTRGAPCRFASGTSRRQAVG